MTRNELYNLILTALGEAEIARVRRTIGSATLRAAVRLIVSESVGVAHLWIPHYWAVYYHDGRGPVFPVTASKLVFYADPKDDPRLAGGYPVRLTDVVRLSREDFLAGLEENTRRREAGEEPFMFVVDSVGPAADHPFFTELARGAAQRADDIVLHAFDEYVQNLVDIDPKLRGERATAFLRI